MNYVFLKLLNMSLAASWAIAAVIVLRFCLRKAPKWLRCVLWAIVAIRLVCPFSLESMFSLIPSAEIISPTAVQHASAPLIDTGIPVVNNTLNPIIRAAADPTSEDQISLLQFWSFVGSIVWISGLTILLGYAIFSFLRIRRKTEEGIRLYDNVYICDAVKSPFILGLIRPRIYLPSDTEETQLDYVLAHEYAHLKRKDHWWKPFGYVLLAVYWFNPLVWAAYILLCRDIELACDEKAVRDMNMDGRKAYSKALLDCSIKRRMIMACPLAFGEVGVKERVKTVLNYRKPAFWLILAAVVTCIAAAFCFLTNPKKSDTLAERIDSERDELIEQIGTLISQAEAVRYSITDWELTVNQVNGERADCYFGANWISSRSPEEDPMIQGMYQTANALSDETQKKLALEAADAWLTEMQSWPEEEYLEQHIVIMLEGQSLALYYPYVMDGVETLIPLQEFVAENWTEDTEKRYQDGVSIIEEAVSMMSPEVPDSESVWPEEEIKEGINHYIIKGFQNDSLLLDEVEWVTDSARAAELGLTENMPGGFYVYNEKESQVTCPFAENCSFTILDWSNNYESIPADRQTFLDTIADRDSMYGASSVIPFIIEIEDGKIISVTEQYVP